MRKLKSMIKKYALEIVFIAILIMMTIICFYLGKQDKKFTEIHYNDVVEILFGNSIGLIAIWISAYFILIQLYNYVNMI